MSDSIDSARRMLASLHGRPLAALTDEERLALCRDGAGCVLCCGYGCGFEGQGSHKQHARILGRAAAIDSVKP